jgi:hypothetical protein
LGCASSTTAEMAKGQDQWAYKRQHDQPFRICAECGTEYEQVLPECSVCARHLCSRHSRCYCKRFRFGARRGGEAAWYWDYEVRCQAHAMGQPVVWLRGWREDDGW